MWLERGIFRECEAYCQFYFYIPQDEGNQEHMLSLCNFSGWYWYTAVAFFARYNLFVFPYEIQFKLKQCAPLWRKINQETSCFQSSKESRMGDCIYIALLDGPNFHKPLVILFTFLPLDTSENLKEIITWSESSNLLWGWKSKPYILLKNPIWLMIGEAYNICVQAAEQSQSSMKRLKVCKYSGSKK